MKPGHAKNVRGAAAATAAAAVVVVVVVVAAAAAVGMAVAEVAALQRRGLGVAILSGDRPEKVAALAGTVEHARRHAAAGADIIIAQGYEAGGHTGEIATMVLVPEVVDAVAPLPVLAASLSAAMSPFSGTSGVMAWKRKRLPGIPSRKLRTSSRPKSKT